ncbi:MULTISPECIES: EamA family transporter RarD [Micromonospora]|uniref:EamA family transporter RarD n=1 Tax=Micromonospora solifontis TaxID=2487138 RepID=A0ABX9WMP5_9ACTN|nr:MULTISPECIES: EamA family transporter RarD [Micromonospora]NES13297.1 EamA family transporter RarD [Micromonospora sp. PPF5-17B]NES34666.1 EamA family transporter RarD [Micromonospora solifontis]NES57182.1 EamA family transporter RarD [Micromonospora sp. PPF5-6]RNM01907.1 EamA family transporter RarD [Micromonospora solifontis]
MNQTRLGYLYGFGAYLIWGFFPIYLKLLRPAGPVEILAHRIVWSVVFVALVLAALRNIGFLRALARRPRALAGITAAAALIAVNWGTYIYGVNSDRVVETALGYFINPLVIVLIGVFLLHERLRPAQWVALGIGGVAVAVLTVDYGRLPYLALTLAFSFAGYGLVKKRLGLPAAEGLFVESAVLALPALGYLAWLTRQGTSTFGHVSVGHTLLLVLAGAVTAIPLLLFAGAANRLPLSTLGMLQYVGPILQLGCGVLIYHEPMPPARLAGFALVWLALVVFTTDAVRQARRTRATARAAAAAPAPVG